MSEFTNGHEPTFEDLSDKIIDLHNSTKYEDLNLCINKFLDSGDEITSQKSFDNLIEYGQGKHFEIKNFISDALFRSHDRVLIEKVSKVLANCSNNQIDGIIASIGLDNCDGSISNDKNFAIRSVRKVIEHKLKNESTFYSALTRIHYEYKNSSSGEEKHNWILKVLLDNANNFKDKLINKGVTANINIDNEILELFYDILRHDVIAQDDLNKDNSNKLQLELVDAIIEVVKKCLSTLGLNSDLVCNAWGASASGLDANNIASTIIYNFKSAREIESECPNSVSVLSEEFGIMDFERYPHKMLIDQFENRNKDDLPYGVIIYPRNDHNGAFYENKPAFIDLFNKLTGQYHIRVFECEDKIGVVKAFKKLKNHYPGHQISFMILGGHGTEYSIHFGGEDKKHELERFDFYDFGPREDKKELKKFATIGQDNNFLGDRYDKRMIYLKDFFEPNSTTILASCSTGVHGGIAQELSSALETKIIAPNIPSNIKSFGPNINENGKLSFQVEYFDEGVAKSYMSGKRINK